LCSLHTLDAAISDDFPMLAFGRLPPFPGGPSGPAGFLQRISTLTSSSLPFFLDFLGAICRIIPDENLFAHCEQGKGVQLLPFLK